MSANDHIERIRRRTSFGVGYNLEMFLRWSFEVFDHTHRLHVIGGKRQRSNDDYQQELFITLHNWWSVQITFSKMCLFLSFILALLKAVTSCLSIVFMRIKMTSLHLAVCVKQVLIECKFSIFHFCLDNTVNSSKHGWEKRDCCTKTMPYKQLQSIR